MPGTPPLSMFLTSNRTTMKSHRISPVLALFLSLFVTLLIPPAYGANKDIIELQTKVIQLHHILTQMKQSFNERMGVMINLLEKNSDFPNKVSAAINEQQTSNN